MVLTQRFYEFICTIKVLMFALKPWKSLKKRDHKQIVKKEYIFIYIEKVNFGKRDYRTPEVVETGIKQQ